MNEEFSSSWWAITLAGEGSVVSGSVTILCKSHEVAVKTEKSLVDAVGSKSDYYHIVLRPVALVQEEENGEPKEVF